MIESGFDLSEASKDFFDKPDSTIEQSDLEPEILGDQQSKEVEILEDHQIIEEEL